MFFTNELHTWTKYFGLFSVDLDITDQDITCSAFVKWSRKNCKMAGKCMDYVQTTRKSMIHVGLSFY
jgi:hypothetical protein